ncbi:MAG: VanZ family protein [Bacilli bacterium]|nr:VanZ family protein [Bacilli bacterium]
MLRETVLNILDNVWPLLIIICTILISLRVVYLIRNHEKVYFYKEVLSLGFVIYIICLFQTVTFQDVAWSTSNFVPFKEMLRYQFGSPLFIRNVLGNVLLFLPYGFFITYFFKFKKYRTPLFLITILSVVIESTQLLIGRVFDIDDIMLNIIGGSFGYLLCKGLLECKEHFPKLLKKTWFYNIIITGLLLFIGLYLFDIIEFGGAL